MELNGIIINGVRYDYIIDQFNGDCDNCDLKKICENYHETGTGLEQLCIDTDPNGIFKESEI